MQGWEEAGDLWFFFCWVLPVNCSRFTWLILMLP